MSTKEFNSPEEGLYRVNGSLIITNKILNDILEEIKKLNEKE